MKWNDAQALISEIRALRCTKGRGFIERLEATAPLTLSPEDSRYLSELYRHAAGGGVRSMTYHKTRGE